MDTEETPMLENLLPESAQNAGGGGGLARDFDILRILQEHFRSAQSDDETREVVFPNTDAPAMRAVFNRDGRLVALNPLPAFTEADRHAIRERIRVELEESTGAGVGRQFFFSLAPVEGWWRHRDVLQILPVPSDAPRPPFSYAHHPFIVEFPYARSENTFTDHARRCRQAWQLHLVLNTLLMTPIWWDGGRTVGTHGHSWVLLPTIADLKEWNVAYLQHSYSYTGFVPVLDTFSTVDGIPSLTADPAERYYRDPLRATGDPLVIPDNLGRSLDLFFQAKPRRRRQFLRSCYWLGQVNELTSFSLSFICAIQAIDALLPPAPPGVRCRECGIDRRPSRTQQFVEFLNRFAPSPTVTDADRRALFEVRSHLSHGFRDPLIADVAVGSALHPEADAERTQGGRAVRTAQVAAYNWLHAEEPTT